MFCETDIGTESGEKFPPDAMSIAAQVCGNWLAFIEIFGEAVNLTAYRVNSYQITIANAC
jgi:hypothetical protein